MRYSDRALTISALITFLFLSAVNAAFASPPKSGDLTIKPYVFENSKKEKVNAEFGRLKVPENRTKKNGKTIELAFVRFKSTSKTPGSPIVYLAGGPGGSGVGTARGSRFPLFMAMRQFGDVIAFDQRGTGNSKPHLQCKERFESSAEAVPDGQEILKMLKRQSRVCADSFRKKGVDLSAYNTNESADDLNDLRKALGAKKISLWGISYGTHLALATIKRHEKRIDRMILAGVEGLQDTIKLPSNIQKHMVYLDKLVKADPNLNKKIPSFIGLVETVLDRVDKNPVVVEITNPATKKPTKVTINKFALQVMTSQTFGRGEAMLPAIYYGMSKGEFTRVAQGWADFNRPGRGIGSAMTFMMDCHSGISPGRQKRVAREAKATLLGGAINLPFPDVCSAWGNPDSGEGFRQEVKRTAIPTLFISGTADVRTPPSNAETVRKGFSNSSHLIIDGAVHSDPLFLSTPKIKETMLAFMNGDTLAKEIHTKVTKPIKFLPIPGGETSQSDANKIDAFISPFARANHFSGVVLAVKDGKVIFEKGYGMANVEHTVPNKLDTRFGIASITKPMTSVVLIRLIESGKVGINDKLSKYIPDFPNGDKITIQMLGRHRSGIPHRVMPPEEEAKRFTSAKFVERVKKAELAFEPGKEELYSSAGYAVLARVLELASGRSFQDLLEEYVFAPAKMNNTVDYDSRLIIPNKAESYLLGADGFTQTPRKDYSFLVGAGSVFSTARDVYKFGTAAIDGVYGKNTQANLVRKGGIFRSNGSTNGYRANVRIDSQNKFGYVVVSNLGSGANDLIINNLRNLLEGKDIKPAKIPSPKIDRSVKNNLGDYLGRYRLGGGGFDILTEGDELYAGPFKLLPLARDKFYSYWSYAEITFKRNKSGKVIGLEWVGSGGKTDWKKDQLSGKAP